MSDSTTAVLAGDPDRLLTTAETAELLGLRSDRTLRNWAVAGAGPKRLRVGRRHIRYRAGDVITWLRTECSA